MLWGSRPLDLNQVRLACVAVIAIACIVAATVPGYRAFCTTLASAFAGGLAVTAFAPVIARLIAPARYANIAGLTVLITGIMAWINGGPHPSNPNDSPVGLASCFIAGVMLIGSFLIADRLRTIAREAP